MKAKVVVELDLYSGMPNPRWQLSDSEVATLERLLGSAREPAEGELHNQLGYRGFILEVEQGGETTVIRVQGGVIHGSIEGAATKTLDQGRALERWLLETGRPHLTAEEQSDAERGLQLPRTR